MSCFGLNSAMIRGVGLIDMACARLLVPIGSQIVRFPATWGKMWIAGPCNFDRDKDRLISLNVTGSWIRPGLNCSRPGPADPAGRGTNGNQDRRGEVFEALGRQKRSYRWRRREIYRGRRAQVRAWVPRWPD